MLLKYYTTMSSKIKILCPKCDWEPDGGSHWECTCSHIWNTFDTGGRCPRCGKVWEDTQCPTCHKMSPHLDWYKGLDDHIKKLIEELVEQEIIV